MSRLNPPAKATAYRIMREALVNARKHAQAGNVTLRLEEHDGSVMLSLTDDGVGAASLKAEPGHFGLATMRARANAEDAQSAHRQHAGVGDDRGADPADDGIRGRMTAGDSRRQLAGRWPTATSGRPAGRCVGASLLLPLIPPRSRW